MAREYRDHKGRLILCGGESIGPEPMAGDGYKGWWIGKIYREDGRELWACQHVHSYPEDATSCAEKRRAEQAEGPPPVLQPN